MNPSYKNIHLRFKFNGLYFDREDFKEVAYSLVKEGKPYEQSVGDFLIDWLNDKDHLYVKTSGATGKPKVIPLQKQHMVNSAIASGDFFGISVGDSALHCLPAEFIAGKMMLVRAMILGLEIDLVEPTSNPLEGIDKLYNFAAMIPLQLENSLSKINQIKKLIVGGAATSKELVQKIQSVEAGIFETYGMTETVTHIAAKQLNNFKEPGEIEKAYFKVLPNVSISQDDRGCLIIDAPDIADEIIFTNDVVVLISNDEFEWLGRFDNIINSGGIKLIPEQIEAKLFDVIEQRYFVAGIKDEKLGEKLVLVIEGDNSLKDTIYIKLKALKNLDKFEMPKEIFFVDKFDETENGKIIRTSTLQNA